MKLGKSLGRGAGFVRQGARLAVAKSLGRSLPFSMTFILSHRCNFRCVYCNIPDAADKEMSEAEFCVAIDELVDEGLARASFSGGEALLRRDAVNIIRHAHSRGLTTSLNSNAWLLKRRLPELEGILDMLVISLDGPKHVHDSVRQQKGSFERVIRALDSARSRNIKTATITVLSRHNLHVIDEVLELARKHGFYAYFQPAYEDCFEQRAGLEPGLGPAVLEDISRRLARGKAEAKPVGASTGYIERLSKGPSFGDCSTCMAGRYFGTVMPNGVVVPCHLSSNDHKYPNGLEIGFGKAFRELPRPNPGPGCAISPYQESDLIFSLDHRAIASAVRRLLGPRNAG